MQGNKQKIDFIIVLNDLTAEGCPVLALNLIDECLKKDIKPMLLRFYNKNNELLDKFISKGITIKSYNLGEKSIYRYLKLVFYTYFICIEYQPKAILSFPLGWHSFLAIGGKLAGISNICAHAGNLISNIKGMDFMKYFICMQLGRPFTSKVICCSNSVKKSIKKSFLMNNRETSVIYNCCDESSFTISKKKSSQTKYLNKRLNIGMVGRLEVHKDQESLINAVEILKKRGININLLLIGDGSKRKYLEELSIQLRVNNQILFLGASNDVNAALDKIDIFVFSTTEDEGFGIALVEAMIKKIPIVASKVKACKEVLLNGKYGLLVKPNSGEAIADGIEFIQNNKKETFKKVDNAYKYAKNNFSKAIMSEKYLMDLDLII